MSIVNCCADGQRVLHHIDGAGYVLASDNYAERFSFCPFCGAKILEQERLAQWLDPCHTDFPPRRICFDVDGVIAQDKPYKPYADRDPFPIAVERLRLLRARGHVIILQTARYMQRCDGNQEKARQRGELELRHWLKQHDIPYDEIYFGKASADYYVDDKAVHVESSRRTIDWNKLLSRIYA